MIVDHAYLSIKIGGVDITSPTPQYIKSFSYERKTAEKGNTFKFTAYDESAMQLEAMLIEGYQDIEFAYGVTASSARRFKGKVSDYNISLSGWGAEIEVTGLSTQAFTNYGARAWYQDTPDNIVRQVAKEQGWSLGIIEPTVAVLSKDEKTGKVVNKVFERNGLPAIKFITDRVLPYCKSAKTGKSGFYFYMTDDNNKVNLHTKEFKTSASVLDITFTVGSRDSVVQEWQPSYSGAAFLSCKGMILEYQDKTGALNRIVKGKAEGAERKLVKVETKDQANLLADYMWDLKTKQSYTGKLTLINKPHIAFFSKVAILALTKNNVPHHSSGMYVVTAVTDTIEGGLIISELSVLGVKA